MTPRQRNSESRILHDCIEGSQANAQAFCDPILLEKADRWSEFDESILITGESGTGKTHIAALFHKLGRRKDGPFVSVNCSAIPHSLFESEFLGHEKGAFTGADANKDGLLKTADNGTLFMDEIGELPLEMQPKLLKALQEGCFLSVGGRKLVHSNFRLICATNRSLEAMVASGQFREDLYYRINILRLNIPPLRKRTIEIRPLAESFLKERAQAYPNTCPSLGPGAIEALEGYPWPGNLHELQAVVSRAFVQARGGLITQEIALQALNPLGAENLDEDSQAEHKAKEMAKNLHQMPGESAEIAAQRLGVGRATIYRHRKRDAKAILSRKS